MNILENLNQRLVIDDGQMCYGGEEDIKKIIDKTPIVLPDDYLEFLRNISGRGELGIVFSVDGGGDVINIWSAQMTLLKWSEFDIDASKEFMEHAWLIGDDLGDLVYFYGNGRDGNGLYRTSAGVMSFTYAEKIADSLTEFLVDGVGIDVAIML